MDGIQSLVHSKTGAVVLDVRMDNHVLVVQAGLKRSSKESHDVRMAVINEEASADADIEMQVGTLMQFHRHMSHLSYNTIELIAKEPRPGVLLSDKKCEDCFTCAQGKQTKNEQSKKDTGKHSPIDRIEGVI